MKSIFDRNFKYRPSFDTDVKKTFERIRREELEQQKRDLANEREVQDKVQKLSKRNA